MDVIEPEQSVLVFRYQVKWSIASILWNLFSPVLKEPSAFW